MLYMLGPFLGVLGIFIILMIDEIFWRLRVIRGEVSRKIVHLFVGTFVAIWPFFMSMREIQILSLAMLVVIAISHRFHIFQSIHGIKRRTYGEFFFPISIGLTALITSSPWIFMAAILHLSLADGLAALVGTQVGQKTTYKVFGQSKSWLGTVTFFMTSLVIVAAIVFSNMTEFLDANSLIIALLPVIATLAESIAVFGSDDLLVPLIVVTVLEKVA